ncbi:MAG TPA: ABC transporter substrate-binding protein [Solirubrobacteraceae bacterium]|jgi:putative hydroxymethylpyrimidine transport system substrate-binding protein|nr:ABC transporter substrate-binding protein [Solirubrobacteraceae bacterium]
MRRLLTLLLLVPAAAVGACGEKHDATGPPGARPFTLVLDFFPNADHAGVYSAMASGEFSRVGLKVTPRVPSDPSAPLKLVAAGQADMAISYEPELLLARDRGLRLVSVGALVQQPLTSIIALGDRHLTGVAGLAGKRVGTAGIPYQSAELKTALSNAGVDPARVQEVNVGFNLVPAMLSHKVDATLGGFWNYEALQLGLAHRNPTVIRVDRAGVPTYDELVLVVREQDARAHGAQIRAFLHALARGEAAVRADPSAAVNQLLAANHDLDRRLQLASVHHSLGAFFPADSTRPFGYQDPRAWDAFGRWMFSHHLLTQPPVAAMAMTDEFLPGQGI